MLQSTYSADSVRGWRNEGKEVTLPATFTFVTSVAGNGDYAPGSLNQFTISVNGGLIMIPASNGSTGNIRLISSQWTVNNIISTGNLSNPYAFNGSGDIFYNTGGNVANTKLILNSQTGFYTYSATANANVGATVGIRRISTDYTGTIVGITTSLGNNFYVNLFNYDGSNLVLESNINLDNGNTFGVSNIYVNPSGNIAVMTHERSSNIQIYNRSGNTWTLDANITNNTRSYNCVINNFGNVLAVNTGNLSNNGTRIYTKSGNTWSLSQTLFSNVAGNTQSRDLLSITNDGTIISSDVDWSPGNSLYSPSVQLINYNSANANYAVTQTLTAGTGLSQGKLTAQPGYLFVTQFLGNTDIYSCL
jgi:hypothetical protein